MAKRRQYQEKGIREDVDYGTQFLNARAAEPRGGPPSTPPPAPVDPGEPAERRSVGFVLMVVLAVGAVIAGVVGFVVLGGDGGSGADGDLITAGDGININDRGVPEAPTTTTTTTEATTTTAVPTTVPTTVAPTTPPTSMAPPATLFPPVPEPPAPTAPPPTRVECPGGSTRTVIDPGQPTVSPGGRFTLHLTGTTTNSTNAAFDLTMSVKLTYEHPAGHSRTMEVRPDQYGRSVAAGGSLPWTATVTVQAVNPPQPVGVTGSWRWSDARYASCPTGTFG